jgi:hypothetical protein
MAKKSKGRPPTARDLYPHLPSSAAPTPISGRPPEGLTRAGVSAAELRLQRLAGAKPKGRK